MRTDGYLDIQRACNTALRNSGLNPHQLMRPERPPSVTRFKCTRCGRLTAGRMPKGGDGTFRFPSRHQVNGKRCEGSWQEAEWVEVPVKTKRKTP